MKGRPSMFLGRRWGTPSEDSDHLAKLINFLNKGRGYAIRSTSANSRAHNGRLVSSYQIVGALPPMESNHSMTKTMPTGDAAQLSDRGGFNRRGQT